jgi:putative ABC transport system ATP-binding protein
MSIPTSSGTPGRPGTPDSGDVALRLVALSKTYGQGSISVSALDQVGLSLARGTFTAVMGPSGSGKSTLLNCASGLDRPSSGEVYIDGARMHFGDETEVTLFRRGRIGFVFQDFNLLPTLTVLQNVTLPARISRTKVSVGEARALLEHVGLGSKFDRRPAELSGGERQRVAIVRAMVTRPKLLFADEPTGALDTRRALEVLALLRTAAQGNGGSTQGNGGSTVVMVTHDPVAAAHADEVLFLADGRLVDRMPEPTASAVAERMTALTDQVV